MSTYHYHLFESSVNIFYKNNKKDLIIEESGRHGWDRSITKNYPVDEVKYNTDWS